MKDEYDFSEAKRGPIAPTKGKTRITIMLDDSVLEAARARATEKGIGYQTLINGLLKEQLIGSAEASATKGDISSLHDEINEMKTLIYGLTPAKVLAAAVRAQHQTEDFLIYAGETASIHNHFRPFKGMVGRAHLPGVKAHFTGSRVLVVEDDHAGGVAVYGQVIPESGEAHLQVSQTPDGGVTISHLVAAKEAR